MICPAIGADETSMIAPICDVRVVATFPHDVAAFTQGLVIVDGQLFESIGLYGKSALRRVNLPSGQVLQETRLAAEVFAEGLTAWREQLVQLTWREELALIYDREQLQPVDYFEYRGEGWGITSDGTHWIISNGSAELRWFDPMTRRVVRRLTVHDGERPITALNELEWIDGEIWANVWQQNVIARIDPTSGAVNSWLNLHDLLPDIARSNRDAVLNGIAYDTTSQRIFITGKYWPTLYQIEPTP
ncbi:glutamine cyclotransferase [Chromatium weissei]|nr:glutamine cyclotransferase [Chromatium weissei]